MQPFELGVTYWPRRNAFQLWEANDSGAMHDEFAQIANLGITHLRLQLLWEAFQPGPQRIGSVAFRILEQALDHAQQSGLRVVPVLFPVNIVGALMLPGWANGVSLIDELVEGNLEQRLPEPNPVAVVCAGSYRINQSPDLFSYRPILRAQRYLIEELVGYFGKHPAISAWQTGEGLEYIHRPGSADAAQRWYASITEAIRARQPGASTIGLVSAEALSQRQGPRPDDMSPYCDSIGVSAAPPEPDNAQRRSDYPAFLYQLVSGLAQRHAIISDLGIPTTALSGGEWRTSTHAGRSGPVFFGDAEQQALYLEVSLSRLLRAGAPGAWLPAYSDYAQLHWTSPPLDLAAHSCTQGIIDASGHEKPAAQSVQDFARQYIQGSGVGGQGSAKQEQEKLSEDERQTQSLPPIPTDIDPERYWRDPGAEFARLWREWVAS